MIYGLPSGEDEFYKIWKEIEARFTGSEGTQKKHPKCAQGCPPHTVCDFCQPSGGKDKEPVK